METPKTFSYEKHKLKREGLSQLDRDNKLLAPDSIQLDDRNTGDLMQFMYQFARQINFYDITTGSEVRSGDWVPFFRKSVPFQYSTIASFDLEGLEERFRTISGAIRSRQSCESLNLLFDLIFDMTDQITRWIADLQTDNSGLKRTIENLIETNLRDQFRKLDRLAKAAGKWGYTRHKSCEDYEELSRFWGLEMLDLFSIDQSILLLKGSRKRKILAALEIQEEIYRTFWKAMQSIKSVADDPEQLERSLVNNDLKNYEPHIGLLFAFLQLFKEAQGGLNGLSDAHLDFFYRKTLQLKEQDILPDHAHLTFELAKKVEQDILLERGTRFIAGKDDDGNNILFELDDELIVNKAKIADLRTLYLDRYTTDLEGNIAIENGERIYNEDICTVEGIYMSPVANSANGTGEAFTKGTVPQWDTVGNRIGKWIDPDKATDTPEDHQHARLGFMVASKMLFLREGKRDITAKITLDDDLGRLIVTDSSLSKRLFNVYLTTAEGWMPVDSLVVEIELKKDGNNPPNETEGNEIIIKVKLPADFPPIVAADPKLLETDYSRNLPMMKFDLNHELLYNEDGEDENGETIDVAVTAGSFYEKLRIRKICRIDLDVAVCDVRQLIIQSDLALLDINKPFMPFGITPKKNSAKFYIGNEEIFCKRWEQVTINAAWKDKPEDLHEHYEYYPGQPDNDEVFKFSVDLLSDKNWIPNQDTNSDTNKMLFFSDTDVELDCELDDDSLQWTVKRCHYGPGPCLDPDTDYDSGPEPCEGPLNLQSGYLADTPCGFIRMELGEQDFLHDKYARTLIENINICDGSALKEKVTALEDEVDSLRGCKIELDGDSGDPILVNVDNDTELNSVKDLKAQMVVIKEKIEAIGCDANCELTGIADAKDAIHDEIDDEIDENIDYNLFGLTGIDAAKAAIDTILDNDISCNANCEITGIDGDDGAEMEAVRAYNNTCTVEGKVNGIQLKIDEIQGLLDPKIPNEPYTPLMETLSVNYTAKTNTELYPDEILFTHLHPYQGTYEHLPIDNTTVPGKDVLGDEIQVKPEDYRTTVLPCFIDEGTLLIGLEDFEPGSNLSLYFQMEPGTANPDMDKAVVCWEYLRNNEWIGLPDDINVLSDTTEGLIKSGIILLSIPSGITSQESTIMPSNLHWLKARVLLRTDAISETLNIQTQAARATYVATELSDLSRLESALAAGSVAKFEAAVPGVKSVQQLYDGFGGRPVEVTSAFEQRISEHLRHKGRAISLHDYERIVLQNFETIYRVKCITHTLGRRGQTRDYELAPGFVTIVVVPELDKIKANDPFKPRLPLSILDEVKTVLKTKVSPFVHIEVLNPIYETISVSAYVKFRAGKSNTFYQERLQNEVKQFLAPWAFSENRQDIGFGGNVYYSTILKFVEDRDYVDYVVDFKMRGENDSFPVELVEASNSRIVLTSGEHVFTPIESEEQLAEILNSLETETAADAENTSGDTFIVGQHTITKF